MNIEQMILIVPRSIISLITLFLITKLIGRKQVSELSLFDYVIGISIGNFSAEMVMGFDDQYINGVIAIVIFGLIAYLVSIVTMKSMTLRRIIVGTPTIIMQNGKILEQSLKKVKIDINDFLEQCRTAGYFNISEINYAIMEANGKLSILPFKRYKPTTPSDQNLKVQEEGICTNIIIDSNLMKNNIKNSNKSIEWVEKQIKSKGYKNYNKILLATLDINDKIYIYEKNINVKSLDTLE